MLLAVILGGATMVGGLAAEDLAPIPGFKIVGGKYVPNEPFVEGQARVTGLQQPFPKMRSLDTNPMTPEKVELGKLLYFDPILSGTNEVSCATCHHPDFGFSDGRKTSMGVGGTGLGPDRTGGDVIARNAPTIWNAAYNSHQFWDGRAADLEQQAEGPIQNPHEMNQKPAELVTELKAIPEYVELFKKVFPDAGEDAVNFRNVTLAIGAFERTILSFNSKFDRYAAGDTNAMNEQERRGLALYRSLKTRCFECHTLPNFTDGTFRVIGVKEEDGTYNEGRAGVPGQGPKGAFKIPTLRNVALNAPYMHNGSIATLEEVVKFYAEGAGRKEEHQIENIDDKIGTFDMTDGETADLVAFMHALTDTSLQPEPPAKVPSGLPVLPVKTKAEVQPERVLGSAAPAAAPVVAAPASGGRNYPGAGKPSPLGMARGSRALASGGPGEIIASRNRARMAALASTKAAAATFTVMPGQSIQAAVDRASAGDLIQVHPGVYNQVVSVDKDGITLEGLVINGERAILDGQGTLPDAVLGSGSDFTIEGFHIRHFSGNGIVVNKARNVVFRNLIAEDAGLYAVYPVECDGVLVEGCVVSGTSDAGIYVGQSRNIVVRNNEVFNNVAGIEIENSVNALVENNSAHHNTGGILVFLLPSGASKVSDQCRVVNNRVWDNNHVNFAKPGTSVSFLPQGTGMLIMGADNVEVTKNEIYGNDTIGISVMSFLSSGSASKEKFELDIEPNCDNVLIYGNQFRDNGKNPHERYVKRGVLGADLYWDGTGNGNGWREPGRKSFPEQLPGTSGMKPIDYGVLQGIVGM